MWVRVPVSEKVLRTKAWDGIDDVGAVWQLMRDVIMGMLLWNSCQKVVVERTYTGIKMAFCLNTEAIDVDCWYLSYFS